MKKVLTLTLAVVAVIAWTLPASALENEFGGYWRTRFFTQQQFSGDNRDESGDKSQVDTRTRLYYTAKINDNLKFVNKFEFDAVWGDDELGDVGADGKVFEIKNSYVDWTMGSLNAKVGIQGFLANRGFSIDDDASGAKLIYTVADGIYLPFSWYRVDEGYDQDNGDDTDLSDLNDGDLDVLTLAPLFQLNKNIKINPTYMYMHSDDAWELEFGNGTQLEDAEFSDVDVHTLALNMDASFTMGSIWFTGAFQTGEMEVDGNDQDVEAYLVALGGEMDMEAMNLMAGDVHGQFFYASGDDDADDDDIEQWLSWPGASYYWSEIMGYGIFDNQASNNSPNEKVSNIWAANLGATVKPIDKLSVTLDVWYAQLAEDVVMDNGEEENELGTEVDLKVTYELVEGLNLDVVGAYLFADDATGEDDPIEVGSRLSLSF